MNRRLDGHQPPLHLDEARDRLPVADVIWHSDAMGRMEHCTVWRRDTGWTITCTTVAPVDGSPGHLIARIRTDSAWNTEEVLVEIHRSRTHHLAILVREAKWHVNGRRRRELDGCRDIDLGWTPASNLLPVRRLGLQIGDETTIDAAWLRFPDLELQRTAQTYTRLSARTWRYRAAAADHQLSVDNFGLVTRYGEDLWKTVATS